MENMNKNQVCAFTIVAKNYIGLGKILEKTLKKHNSNIDFWIIVADEFSSQISVPENVIVAKESLSYSDFEWRDMSFKYNLTEFCTAIKPASFKLLFEKGYSKILYFDPDIYVFSSLSEIITTLDKSNFVMTPHIAGVHLLYGGEHPEWHMNVNGIFNLGFLGVSRSDKSIAIIDWWTERLKDQCFCERTKGQFTDQKWMDWIPGFVDSENLKILRNLGMNLAPWNFFERKIDKGADGKYYVSFRDEDSREKRRDELVFVHYSGYDYSKLKNGIVEHKRLRENVSSDIQAALNEYGSEIKENAALFDSFIAQSYSYNQYSNGDLINEFHRRLYHGLDSKKREFINPFDVGQGTFYSQLKRNGLINKSVPAALTKKNVEGIESKKRWLNKFFKIIYGIVGYKRYVQFVKSMRFYSLPEMHTFLIDQSKLEH